MTCIDSNRYTSIARDRERERDLMYVTTQQITHNYQRRFIFGIVFCASLIKRVVTFFSYSTVVFVVQTSSSLSIQKKPPTTKIDENRRRTIRLLYLQLNWSIWNGKQKKNDKNVFSSWRSRAWQIWFMEMLMIFLYLLFSFVRLDSEIHCTLGMSHKISEKKLANIQSPSRQNGSKCWDSFGKIYAFSHTKI